MAAMLSAIVLKFASLSCFEQREREGNGPGKIVNSCSKACQMASWCLVLSSGSELNCSALLQTIYYNSLASGPEMGAS